MPTNELTELKADFLLFRGECIWVRTCYEMFEALFGDDEPTKNALELVAPVFFQDLNTILIEYWISVVTRITDPPGAGDKTNLTAQYLVEELNLRDANTPKIRKSCARLTKYGDVLRKARNKLVSHVDRTAFRDGKVLGAHTERELHRFMHDLQEFCDLVGTAVGEGPADFRGLGTSGDVHSLAKALRSLAKLAV